MGLYGRQGRIVAKPGQRAALVDILAAGTKAEQMPGCHFYLVGTDETEHDTILVTEVWDTEAAHKASLGLPAVREAIGKAMPLIESVDGSGMAIVSGWPDEN